MKIVNTTANQINRPNILKEKGECDAQVTEKRPCMKTNLFHAEY